jgi:hypothetical protein
MLVAKLHVQPRELAVSPVHDTFLARMKINLDPVSNVPSD